MIKNVNNCDDKNVGRRWLKIQSALLPIYLVSLTACQITNQPNLPPCDPTPPRFEWSMTDDNKVILSREALGELMNYIHDLSDCVTAIR
ncbi:hypothetical protein [Shewanella sp.]|uniref:hypothetical protein n=1 Tax=Shewanella sp. TaxID=50422 RepID=UPI001ED4C363|nr:hypothetical protein [Shewanella sp.]NRB25247.1 hypothetical protein [Shewanella sp.]